MASMIVTIPVEMRVTIEVKQNETYEEFHRRISAMVAEICFYAPVKLAGVYQLNAINKGE